MKPLEDRLSPIIKWAGGKEKELPNILPNMPATAGRYIEPFVGGGAVALAVDAQNILINDKSEELILLYRMVKEGNRDFFKTIEAINYNWKCLEQISSDNQEYLTGLYRDFSRGCIGRQKIDDLVIKFIKKRADQFNGLLDTSIQAGLDNFIKEIRKNLVSKMVRMKKIEQERRMLSENDLQDNLECAFKSAFYMHLRYIYNRAEVFGISKPVFTAIFYFIRDYCYSSMFRYNKKGHFNVPYGGLSYNRKYLDQKIDYLRSLRLQNHMSRMKIFCLDFQDFLAQIEPAEEDFIFFDPPYDSDFSTYAQNSFGKDDQVRLNRVIRCLKSKFMLVIKNTELIAGLYPESDFRVQKFNKRYLVSFQNRNNKEAEHLMITNY